MFIFEWDDQKATSNLQKHGVTFDEAVSMFADGLALTFADTDHFESEERNLRHLKQGTTSRGSATTRACESFSIWPTVVIIKAQNGGWHVA
jgi:uncharacterized DUF497 family protein